MQLYLSPTDAQCPSQRWRVENLRSQFANSTSLLMFKDDALICSVTYSAKICESLLCAKYVSSLWRYCGE